MLLKWFDRIVSGKVVAKHHYGYAGVHATAPTKLNAIFYEGPVELAQAPAVTESRSLTIAGVDKHGRSLKKEVYVDEMTYNTAGIGDAWPIVSPQSASAS